MNLVAKKRVARGVILFLGIWPLMHFVLISTGDLDPWKLGGFAMYTAPRFSTTLRLFGVEGGIPYNLVPDRISESTMKTASRYLIHRRALNSGLRPDSVARRLLEDFPEFERIRIEVVRMKLDRSDGILKAESRTFEYPETGADRAN